MSQTLFAKLPGYGQENTSAIEESFQKTSLIQ